MNGDAFRSVRRPLGLTLSRSSRGARATAQPRGRPVPLRYAAVGARDRLLITCVGQHPGQLEQPVGGGERVFDARSASRSSCLTTVPVCRRERASCSEHAQRRIRERVVVRHPLQPFSTRYFTGDATLFSYATGYYRAPSL